MRKDKLRKIIAEDLEKIGQHCREIGRKFDEKRIHEFRVQAKKTRAVLKLAALQAPGSELKFSRRVKELYRLAGMMRDYQLMLQEVDDNIPELCRWLRHNIGIARHKWQDNYKPKVITRFADKVAEQVKAVEMATVIKFFRRHCKTVRKTITGNDPEDEGLHELRKLLKDMLYISDFCKDHWSKAYLKLERFPLGDLKPLATLAGNYNDHSNRISFLYAFASVFPATATTPVFTQLLRTYIAQRQQLKTELLSVMQQFVAKLPKH